MPRIKGTLPILNNIAVLRAQKNITQEELAEAIGITRATIIAIEKGSYNPSLELAFRLSRYFHTGIEKMFSIKGE